MLGSSRLFLAALVALSHDELRVAGLHPGVMAVVSFYPISGYVMTGLLRKHYRTLNEVGGFYIDRFLRLFPVYWFVAGVTAVWLFVAGAETNYLRVIPDGFDWFANLTVIPLNFYMGSTQRMLSNWFHPPGHCVRSCSSTYWSRCLS